MILNVRGAIGIQIYQLFTGYARAIETNQNISEIHVNLMRGGAKEFDTNACVDYISSLFDFSVPVRSVNNGNKTMDMTGHNLDLIFKHLSQIKQLVRFKAKVPTHDKTVVHMRGNIRSLVSVDDYVKLIKYINDSSVVIVGEDLPAIKLVSKKTNRPFYRGDSAVKDWLYILGAKKVYAPFSFFTISTILLNHQRALHFIDETLNNGETKMNEAFFIEYRQLAEAIFRHIPKGGFINESTINNIV